MSKRTRRSTSPASGDGGASQRGAAGAGNTPPADAEAGRARATGAAGGAEGHSTSAGPPGAGEGGGARQPSPRPPTSGARPARASSRAAAGGGEAAGGTTSRGSGASHVTSASPSGTPRAGRRPRPRTYQRSLFDRYRSLIVGGGILAGLVLFGAYVFLGSTGTAYACGTQLDPASPQPQPSGTPLLGQVVPDMGRSHVNPGTQANYTYCPPGSGPHYNIAGRGPIAPRFYPPDSNTEPQGWIHNLEHGGMVILYSCAAEGSCLDVELDQLRALVSNFPASPICQVQGGVISPVIARFDSMKTKYAAVVWNRALLQDELDIPAMLEFFAQSGERNNPERQCAPPSPSTTPSVTFGTSPEPSGSPAASPSPAGSPAGSPQPSVAPTAS